MSRASTSGTLSDGPRGRRHKYNPVLFSRRETQTVPSPLKHGAPGSHLIHNVHSSPATGPHVPPRGAERGRPPPVDDDSDLDDDPIEDVSAEEGASPEKKEGFWARCCQCCCRGARSRKDDDYDRMEDDDRQEGSRSRGLKQAVGEDAVHLSPQPDHHKGRKTLALDLDETLVHSSFKEVPGYDIRLEVEIDHTVVQVYVMVRPGVQDLLQRLAKHYEIVVYTASLAKYANPLLDILDPDGHVSARLFREHCAYHSGSYVKDLAALGRSLSRTLIVDNSPTSYMFHPNNGIPCSNFIDDKSDRELYDIIEFCERIHTVPDVTPECLKYKHMWRRKYNNGRPHGL